MGLAEQAVRVHDDLFHLECARGPADLHWCVRNQLQRRPGVVQIGGRAGAFAAGVVPDHRLPSAHERPQCQLLPGWRRGGEPLVSIVVDAVSIIINSGWCEVSV